jgi:hypothetical protein
MSQGSGQDGSDAAHDDAITWVGMQHLMSGYCGRAKDAPGNGGNAAAGNAADAQRPIAVVRTRARQGRVVRIGPPRINANRPDGSGASMPAA